MEQTSPLTVEGRRITELIRQMIEQIEKGLIFADTPKLDPEDHSVIYYEYTIIQPGVITELILNSVIQSYLKLSWKEVRITKVLNRSNSYKIYLSKVK